MAPSVIFDIIWERAASSSADYIQTKLDTSLVFPSKELLWNFALQKVNITDRSRLFVEFGVFQGYSTNYFAKILGRQNLRIYGFDSFEGLKEDWSGHFSVKGSFSLGGKLPEVLPNVTLIKGWFDSTVPQFLSEQKSAFAFIHMDADTYESTQLVLNLLHDRIVKDTVIVFDEYVGVPNWQKGEFLAWRDFCKNHNVEYKYLGFSNQQAAVQIV